MELKTSAEWNKVDKIKILDPDGWDRTNYNYSFHKEKISHAEYTRRILLSTIHFSEEAKKRLMSQGG